MKILDFFFASFACLVALALVFVLGMFVYSTYNDLILTSLVCAPFLAAVAACAWAGFTSLK